MKYLIKFVSFLIIFTISNSTNVSAATAPSMGVTWNYKGTFVTRMYMTPNGYKGVIEEDGARKFLLVNPSNKILYTYTSKVNLRNARVYKDGTAYLTNANDEIIALTNTGKVRWIKHPYSGDLTLDLTDDGGLYASGFENGEWISSKLNLTDGKTIWSNKTRGFFFVGNSDNTIMAKSTSDNNNPYFNVASFYSNGKLKWSHQTPSGYGIRKRDFVKISPKGNVAVISQKGALTDRYIQVYNASGKRLFTKYIDGEPNYLGQVIFNDKGELLITTFDTTNTTKLKCEWYNLDGKRISSKLISIPKGPVDYREYITKIDNDKNIFLHTQNYPLTMYKYNSSGKVVGKTTAPTDFEYDESKTLTNSSNGLVFFKNDFKNDIRYARVYSYK
ncbi:hypothetical protein ACQCPQ_05670 [Priestia megaterium]|uniref:hypothetical protein n=1 Tax=Priestia megaterium TaxID=1404 RepID=UPI003D0890B1